MKMNYLQIKTRIAKLNAYYIKNQGEYMNNYKKVSTNQLEEMMNIHYDLVVLVDIVKNYCSSRKIFEFSGFDLKEIDSTKNIIESLGDFVEVSGNEYLDEKDNVLMLHSYVFSDKERHYYNELASKVKKENDAYNFALRSLNLQKKYSLEECDLASVIKIGDEIIRLKKIITDHKNKIVNINNEILQKEKAFFDDYISLLNDIADNKLKFNKEGLVARFSDNVIAVYKAKKLIEYVKSINKDMSIDDLIVVFHDQSLQKTLQDMQEKLYLFLDYVGTDS